eukprot:TRINITY_DN41840_c0_g1_i1.p1 TRINITY_DN41840_c0_g1~~TRINITY_DN41840_c0_g1_i1.p1  ORF type:complete len:682 (-),score=115.88 TRINITY_DN41840_c0_g1_i1:103-2148(-)
MPPVQCGYDCMYSHGHASTHGYDANASDEEHLDLCRQTKLCHARRSLVTLLEQQERSKATLLFVLNSLDSLGTGQVASGRTELQRQNQDDESTNRVSSQTGTLLSPHPMRHAKDASRATHGNLQRKNTCDESSGMFPSQTGTLLSLHAVKYAKEALDEVAVAVPSVAAHSDFQASSSRSASDQEVDTGAAVESQACATIGGDMQTVACATPCADMQDGGCATPYDHDVQRVLFATRSEASGCSGVAAPRLQSMRRISTQGTTDIIMRARHSLQRHAHGEQGFWGGTRQTCEIVVKSSFFRYLVFTVTLINVLCLGIEAQWSLDPFLQDEWPRAVDASFVMFFMIELLIRLTADDLNNFLKSWFVLDSLLVLVDLVREVILLLHRGPERMQPVMVALRTLRLLRLVRVLRMVHSLKQVLLLLYGVFTSGSTVISTFTILALLLYVWAILGVELITCNRELNTDPDAAQIVETHFGSVQSSLLTLVQFVSMDAMAAIYTPLIKKTPHLALYFLSVFFSVSVLLMNLITSVLIRATLENAEADKIVKRQALHDELKQLLPELEEVFESLDTQHAGVLTTSEFDHFPMELIPKEFWIPFFVTSMEDIFEMLDIDCSGTLTQQDFVHGISALFLVGTPIEHIRSMSLTKIALKQMRKLQSTVESICEDAQKSKNAVVHQPPASTQT